jgi:hypothetical protein
VTPFRWLTCDDFAGRLGERFEMMVGDDRLTVELTEASEGSGPGGRGPDGQERRQFSLVFRGPATRVVPQGTYRLTQEELGELDLFLVPIGPDAEGMQYQALFA